MCWLWEIGLFQDLEFQVSSFKFQVLRGKAKIKKRRVIHHFWVSKILLSLNLSGKLLVRVMI